MKMFLDRERELDGLRQRYQAGQAELFVLYGRRRVGKSALIREFCRGKPHTYFLASQVRERDNLDQFREALARDRPDPLLESLRFNSWEAAFAYLTRSGEGERFVVALDEFPYLCQDNPALPSIVQKWWDTRGKSSKMLLLLCGSQISLMEHELLGERSPLYGRRTGQQRLGPLLPWDAARFFPGYSLRDRLAAYGILGGVPAYLERFDPNQSLKANVMREALNPQGFLYDEVHFLLRTELTQIATYLSLLKAVAGGATRITEIAARAGVPPTAASRYLGTLRELDLIRRDVPFTERQPEKSKRGVYVVGDPFVAFWCRFILPHQSLIQAGQGATVWREFIRPALDAHLGIVFEEVCRQYVLHRWADTHGAAPRRVGRLWAGDYDVDVLAELVSGKERQVLVGECKWWKAPVGRNVLEELQARAQSLPALGQGNIRLAVFSLSGFTDELRTLADRENVILVDGEGLLAT
jgi:AAA+ ATPase superfamily predicted ATPase